MLPFSSCVKVYALSTVKVDVCVRISPAICAPQPNSSPIFWHNVRIYVPLEHNTSISTTSSSMLSTLASNMVIFLGLRSTSIPFLANSYSFLPPNLIAEYIGGICSISPMNFWIAVTICSSVKLNSFTLNTFPLASCVSVVTPNFIFAV